jgi:hypothetical protein
MLAADPHAGGRMVDRDSLLILMAYAMPSGPAR